MSKERGQRPDILSSIDDVLKEAGVAKEAPFKPVSAPEIKYLTDQIRAFPPKQELVDRLNELKQSALGLILIGENGRKVPKGDEYFPGSKELVVKAYDVHRLNNENETINFRNNVLSHVLSINSDVVEPKFKKQVREVQKEYSSIKDAFGKLSR